jgi:hypothetical protein
MENTPVPDERRASGLPRFDVDFQPGYSLTEVQYQLIINQLANLVFANIEQLKQTKQGQAKAQQLAAHASQILSDYDEDMAEIIHTAGQRPRHRAHPGDIQG